LRGVNSFYLLPIETCKYLLLTHCTLGPPLRFGADLD
jgi:hypothetical protein